MCVYIRMLPYKNKWLKDCTENSKALKFETIKFLWYSFGARHNTYIIAG